MKLLWKRKHGLDRVLHEAGPNAKHFVVQSTQYVYFYPRRIGYLYTASERNATLSVSCFALCTLDIVADSFKQPINT